MVYFDSLKCESRRRLRNVVLQLITGSFALSYASYRDVLVPHGPSGIQRVQLDNPCSRGLCQHTSYMETKRSWRVFAIRLLGVCDLQSMERYGLSLCQGLGGGNPGASHRSTGADTVLRRRIRSMFRERYNSWPVSCHDFRPARS